MTEDLQRLARMRSIGELTDDEYKAAKALVLRGAAAPEPPPVTGASETATESGAPAAADSTEAEETGTNPWVAAAIASALVGLFVRSKGAQFPVDLLLAWAGGAIVYFGTIYDSKSSD